MAVSHFHFVVLVFIALEESFDGCMDLGAKIGCAHAVFLALFEHILDILFHLFTWVGWAFVAGFSYLHHLVAL